MRLALDSDPRLHLVRSYGEGIIVIGERRLAGPCIVSPTQGVREWEARSFAELSEQQLAPLLALGAGIVLLGAGQTQPFPHPRLRGLFRARSVALECMNLGAACRTYNVLANEGRAVVAGLFP